MGENWNKHFIWSFFNIYSVCHVTKKQDDYSESLLTTFEGSSIFWGSESIIWKTIKMLNFETYMNLTEQFSLCKADSKFDQQTSGQFYKTLGTERLAQST
jgi:hypothetical protein